MGTSNRFGVRAGKRVRDKVDRIEKRMRDKHKCPQCHRKSVKRVSTGIWKCTKCGLKFAGG
ncbi:MAG: 50S ribosomal protein L37ae, partial [Euryarchaeota archaeon]|nr:50S ribosomal protein L37ae [Euryarchaeota archaeon]